MPTKHFEFGHKWDIAITSRFVSQMHTVVIPARLLPN